MPQCEHCGKEVDLPFECKFCGGYYCLEHRLPESHNCPNLPPRTPLGSWQTRKEMAIAHAKEKTERFVSEGDYHFIRETSQSEKLETKKPFPTKKVVSLILLGILLVSVIFYAPTILHYFNPSEKESGDQTTTTQKYTTSIYFEGFRITQNDTHLIIEDYSSEWAPYYYISFKNGTGVIGLVAYETEGNNTVAEYAYVTRNYAKEIYSLKDILSSLPSSEYIFEIYTHNRRYSIVIDHESERILFGNYSSVFYLPPFSWDDTIYEVVFEHFNETVFQQIKEHIFNNNPSYYGDKLDQIQRLVEWADLNVEYQFLKVLPVIYDPLTFMEKKEGVCIDYAVFYASGLLTIGFDEAYILILNTTKGLHAAAGVEYNNSMLILEQKMPVWEFQDYIDNLETIIGASIQPPIHAYKVKYESSNFTIEFFNSFK